MSRAAPTRARLIHLLIEERARAVAFSKVRIGQVVIISEADLSQARREIEREVLIPRTIQ